MFSVVDIRNERLHGVEVHIDAGQRITVARLQREVLIH